MGVKVTNNDEHSSFLKHGIHYDSKTSPSPLPPKNISKEIFVKKFESRRNIILKFVEKCHSSVKREKLG